MAEKSCDAVMQCWPSGVTTTSTTQPLCPVSTPKQVPRPSSHTRAKKSSDAVTAMRLSGVSATRDTVPVPKHIC
jgi:hypothetical protein